MAEVAAAAEAVVVVGKGSEPVTSKFGSGEIDAGGIRSIGGSNGSVHLNNNNNNNSSSSSSSSNNNNVSEARPLYRNAIYDSRETNRSTVGKIPRGRWLDDEVLTRYRKTGTSLSVRAIIVGNGKKLKQSLSSCHRRCHWAS